MCPPPQTKTAFTAVTVVGIEVVRALDAHLRCEIYCTVQRSAISAISGAAVGSFEQLGKTPSQVTCVLGSTTDRTVTTFTIRLRGQL